MCAIVYEIQLLYKILTGFCPSIVCYIVELHGVENSKYFYYDILCFLYIILF